MDGAQTTRTRGMVFVTLTAAAIAGTALLPRVAQPESYHHFADTRTLLGIPNALNVLSNLPFLMVGLMGLWWMWRTATHASKGGSGGAPISIHFRDPLERWPAGAVFAGMLTTGIGSAYYHLQPSSQTLVFDRLGMVVGFMAILPMAVGERVSARWGAWLLAPMIALGAASVLYWERSELSGQGDLRWYFLAQAYGFIATAAVLLGTRAAYDRQVRWLEAIGCYAAAKVFEVLDRPIYSLSGNLVSGHSLKHVAAALGGWFLLQMLRERKASVVR